MPSRGQHTSPWMPTALYLLSIASLSIIAASGMTGWQQSAFLIVAVAAAGATLVRQRYPRVLLLPAWAAAAFATQILLIPALLNLGVRGRDRRNILALVVTLLLLAAVAPREEQLVSIDGADLELWPNLAGWVLNGIIVALVPYVIGRGIATRRDLIESYRLRTEHAEAERSARAAESVLLERARIAREAHDVLGHKLSLLAMQSGGLRLNADSGAEVVERQAQLIQQSARGALDDLRSIIGSLEDPDAPCAEQDDRSLNPKDLVGLRKMVDESVSSGDCEPR